MDGPINEFYIFVEAHCSRGVPWLEILKVESELWRLEGFKEAAANSC